MCIPARAVWSRDPFWCTPVPSKFIEPIKQEVKHSSNEGETGSKHPLKCSSRTHHFVSAFLFFVYKKSKSEKAKSWRPPGRMLAESRFQLVWAKTAGLLNPSAISKLKPKSIASVQTHTLHVGMYDPEQTPAAVEHVRELFFTSSCGILNLCIKKLEWKYERIEERKSLEV